MESILWPEATAFLAPLAPWFEATRRPMPWRAAELDGVHPDPYAVLVSELMLQQTQVATVIPFFQRWLQLFPDPTELARATEDAVHKAWEGLGYYRRARHLQEACRSIAARGWPETLTGLLELPGLGPYTAAAVASIAFQWPEPALDGNALRVLARLLALPGDPKIQAPALRVWLRPALRALGPSRMTQALMELGATICGPAPRCEACPLGAACCARQEDLQGLIPPPARRAQQKHVELRLLAIRAEGSFLLRPPSAKGLLPGLWTWPSVPVEPASESVAEATNSYGVEAYSWPGWIQVYSHLREAVEPVQLCLDAAFRAPQVFVWVPAEGIAALPMGKRDSRLRDLLGTPGLSFTGNASTLLARARDGAPNP